MCCGPDPICFYTQNFAAASDNIAHDLGVRGTDFDGSPRANDASWLSLPAHGSGFLSAVTVDIEELAMPCSTRHAYVLTHFLAVDSTAGADTNILTLEMSHYTTQATIASEQAFVVRRSDFAEAAAVTAFPIAFSNLQCNAYAFGSRVFVGFDFPFSDFTRAAPAAIMHYASGVQVWRPQTWSPSEFQLGAVGTLTGGVATSSLTSQGFLIASGPNVQLPVGELQVEFVLSLDSSTAAPSALAAVVDIYCEARNITLATRAVLVSELTSAPTTVTLTASNTLWSTGLLSFRVQKLAASAVSLRSVTACAHTDGAACALQSEDSCDESLAPTAAPTHSVCQSIGESCLTTPCCNSTKCEHFGDYAFCISDHKCVAAPTSAPTQPPIVAYISAAFEVDIHLWEINSVQMNWEYTQAVTSLLSPLFSDVAFGDIIIRPGSTVVSLPWTNVPYSVLQNPSLVTGILPPECLHFPNEFLLAQIPQLRCAISFLRLCADGTLIEWTDVCPHDVTFSPTESPSVIPVATNAPTRAPSTVQREEAGGGSTQAGFLKDRNFNIVLGVSVGIVFCCLLLCCFFQHRRKQRVAKALFELTTAPTHDDLSESFDAGADDESEIELSQFSASPSASLTRSPGRSPRDLTEPVTPRDALTSESEEHSLTVGCSPSASPYVSPHARARDPDHNPVVWDDVWRAPRSSLVPGSSAPGSPRSLSRAPQAVPSSPSSFSHSHSQLVFTPLSSMASSGSARDATVSMMEHAWASGEHPEAPVLSDYHPGEEVSSPWGNGPAGDSRDDTPVGCSQDEEGPASPVWNAAAYGDSSEADVALRV